MTTLLKIFMDAKSRKYKSDRAKSPQDCEIPVVSQEMLDSLGEIPKTDEEIINLITARKLQISEDNA